MLKYRNALGLALCALTASPAGAQYIGGSPPPLPDKPIGPESPADALARNVRILAQSPRDYAALLGGGRAALATGDAEVAVGFFGRAADVSPNAPAPKAGMGAALAAMGEAAQALPMFDQAQRAGGSVASFAADRGLAHDLLGQQALAQADYRLALGGPQADEARRRLALSQAISGDRSAALATLAPLRGDPATNRTRAFVLALGGDWDGAERALDAAMPGMAGRLDPFFRRLASLAPAQKAAAVHLGIMPGSGGEQIASAPPQPSSSRRASPQRRRTYAAGSAGDRLSEIDSLLIAEQQSPAAARLPAPPDLAVRQVASNRPSPSWPIAAMVPAPRRFWVQLASGTDAAMLGAQFNRIAARDPDQFKNISPYLAQVEGRFKLLIGPFHSSDDRATFIDNLSDAHIDGSGWTSPEGLPVRKLVAP